MLLGLHQVTCRPQVLYPKPTTPPPPYETTTSTTPPPYETTTSTTPPPYETTTSTTPPPYETTTSTTPPPYETTTSTTPPPYETTTSTTPPPYPTTAPPPPPYETTTTPPPYETTTSTTPPPYETTTSTTPPPYETTTSTTPTPYETAPPPPPPPVYSPLPDAEYTLLVDLINSEGQLVAEVLVGVKLSDTIASGIAKISDILEERFGKAMVTITHDGEYIIDPTMKFSDVVSPEDQYSGLGAWSVIEEDDDSSSSSSSSSDSSDSSSSSSSSEEGFAFPSWAFTASNNHPLNFDWDNQLYGDINAPVYIDDGTNINGDNSNDISESIFTFDLSDSESNSIDIFEQGDIDYSFDIHSSSSSSSSE